jgi:hypothetical protein
VELLEQRALLLRELPLDAVEEERRLVEQPLGRARVLDDDRVGELRSSSSRARVSSLPV